MLLYRMVKMLDRRYRTYMFMLFQGRLKTWIARAVETGSMKCLKVMRGNIAKGLVEKEKKPTFKPDSERTDRSKEEMEKEAAWLSDEMAKDDAVE